MNPDNYRPISVIPTLGKILEKVVYSRLMHYLDEHNILTPFQSGFRPNYSTEDVLLKTVEDWRLSVDRGNAVAAVFIDFSKAFDSISYPLLVKKLQSIGVADIALTWFHDFLTNRQQRVVIDGHASSWLTIQKGVPQGSLLGPLLFSIYTNDMPLTVKNCSINMYADDTALYTANTNAFKAANSVSKDLTATHKRCLDNSITINFKKTYAMFLSRNLRSLTSQCNNAMIYLNGLPLQTVTEIRYLGVIIDSKLSFKSHISSIISKAYGALKTLTRAQASLPLSIRKRLYKALVLPILEYCPSVWEPSTSALSDEDYFKQATGNEFSSSQT